MRKYDYLIAAGLVVCCTFLAYRIGFSQGWNSGGAAILRIYNWKG